MRRADERPQSPASGASARLAALRSGRHQNEGGDLTAACPSRPRGKVRRERPRRRIERAGEGGERRGRTDETPAQRRGILEQRADRGGEARGVDDPLGRAGAVERGIDRREIVDVRSVQDRRRRAGPARSGSGRHAATSEPPRKATGATR